MVCNKNDRKQCKCRWNYTIFKNTSEKDNVTIYWGFLKVWKLACKQKLVYVILQKIVLVKRIAETAEKQNSSYSCVINTNLKPNI